MRATRWTAIVASILAFSVSACARNAAVIAASQDDEAQMSNRVDVFVTNNNFADMKVYVVTESGGSIRVGTVNGLTSGKVTVHRVNFPSGILRLAAAPIGGSGVARTDALRVMGGESVNFTVHPNLAMSFGLLLR